MVNSSVHDVPATWHPESERCQKVRPVQIACGAVVITLADGREAFVDTDDLELVAGRNWWAESRGYPTCGVGVLPRMILPPPPGYVVDHIDRNRLNNRRGNLRLATRHENSRNRSKAPGKSSEYMGVSLRSDRGTWSAAIRVGGRRIKLGTFKDEVSAALAYDHAAARHFGEFATLNFPVPGGH
jgi:hypothetical protein